MRYLYTLIILSLTTLSNAQVGIGTTNPQETLHINGTMRIENSNPTAATKLMGGDDNGTINDVAIGSNLELAGGALHATGTNKYFVATVNITTTSSGDTFNNIDLDLNGANKDMTVFRLTGASHGYGFTGISGGIDGRHIVLLNIPSQNFRISDEDSGSDPENRFITLSGGFEQTSGQGAIELVYDGILKRWIVINFRN